MSKSACSELKYVCFHIHISIDGSKLEWIVVLLWHFQFHINFV